jgi:hypothetical protein
MSKPFKLSLERVHCNSQQAGEWGSDEIYLVGFGISKSGTRFTIKPRSLGSFNRGDTSGSGYPKSLVDIQVSDSESLVSTCIWLFERDSGGLAGAGNQLEATFNSFMDKVFPNANLGLSPDARQYYAFGMTMHTMQFSLETEAIQGINADELLMWIYHDHLPVDRLGINSYELNFGFQGAAYALTFRYQLAPPIPVVGPPS